MVNPAIIGVMILLIVIAVILYWKFDLLTRRQFTWGMVGMLLLFILGGAWSNLVGGPSSTTVVVYAPLFFFVWYYLSIMIANLIHMDEYNVIHFN